MGRNAATNNGTCQCCGASQRLPQGVLAKHGYTTRWGFFEGVCKGSGYQPFEKSTDLIEGFIRWAQGRVGLCLFESERNGRDDSDFFMTVWDPQKQAPERFEFGTTRGYCGPAMSSHADATAEVWAAYREWERKRDEAARQLHAERVAKMPSKGMTLKVVKGRKVPVGTVGRCFWSSTQFKTDKVLGILFLGYEGRVGIETPAGRVFTNVDNVEVVQAC